MGELNSFHERMSLMVAGSKLSLPELTFPLPAPFRLGPCSVQPDALQPSTSDCCLDVNGFVY